MMGGVLVLSGRAAAIVLMTVALALNTLVIVLRIKGTRSSLDLYLVALACLLIACTLAVAVSRTVFGPGRVTFHRVIGAVLLYLLIALVFVSLFVVLGALAPGAISGIKFEDNAALASTLVYFRFVTLTSTGYGDIVPLHPLARALCNVESIVGQLYPATLLARLVTLELDGRR